jgi:hypothetical protein
VTKVNKLDYSNIALLCDSTHLDTEDIASNSQGAV